MVKYVTCAISWGRCSLVRLLVVMSVVVVLVVLSISFLLEDPLVFGGNTVVRLRTIIQLYIYFSQHNYVIKA